MPDRPFFDMQPTEQPISQDLVFIGGGHSHAIALRLFGMNPLPGVRITLISDVSDTPYSGMLPGYIAGFYDYDDSHIDLRPLANFAGAQFYRDRAVGLDLANNRVICANRPPVAFDILSIDIGSTPATISVPGAADYAIPAKPVPKLLHHWHQLIEELQTRQSSVGAMPPCLPLQSSVGAMPPCLPLQIGIVGGGAGGVELALSMSARLNQLLGSENRQNLQIHLFQRSRKILPTHNSSVRQKLQKILRDRGIKLHLSESVSRVESRSPQPPLERGAMSQSVSRVESRSPQPPLERGAMSQSDSEPPLVRGVAQPGGIDDKPPLVRGVAQPGGIVVHCESGLTVECDRLFWVTQASAPDWLKKSGLKTDADGFIQVSETLQSISHSHIFACGDIASAIEHPRPKAGVFAVRQGQPLFENLQRILQGQPLKPFKPQKEFLTLIGTGKGSAIASRGDFGLGPSPLLWLWKDWIDRQFMDKFCNFPEMHLPRNLPRNRVSIPRNPVSSRNRVSQTMRCAGCGSKVGSTTLKRVLHRINDDTQKPFDSQKPGFLEKPGFFSNENILIGLNTPDDCAVVKVPSIPPLFKGGLGGDLLMVQTIDYFPSLMNDPFIFGQISANHSLSDIFAMGATPQTALAIATIPYATPAKTEEILYQLLAGATKVLNESQTSLVGGHTTEGKELAFGLSCNGFVTSDKLLRKSGMEPGQVLILTKALGTGTLFAADMRKKAKGRWIENAIESMLLSNQKAAESFMKYGATACTDITGFGLLGHLMEMIAASNDTNNNVTIHVEINLEAIGILEGARETVAQGILSSLHPENFQASSYIHNLARLEHHVNFPLLFDPQTSGGLLASVPYEQAHDCLADLKALGYCDSNIIGQIKPGIDGVWPITLTNQ